MVLRARIVPVTKMGSDRLIDSGVAVVTFTDEEVSGVVPAFLSPLDGFLSQPADIAIAKMTNSAVIT